jgi:hypothetical protein
MEIEIESDAECWILLRYATINLQNSCSHTTPFPGDMKNHLCLQVIQRRANHCK